MGKRRSSSAEEKLKIVMEGLKEGNKISEVCRRHDIHSSQFYDWKEKAMLGAKEGLKPKRNGKSKELSLCSQHFIGQLLCVLYSHLLCAITSIILEAFAVKPALCSPAYHCQKDLQGHS